MLAAYQTHHKCHFFFQEDSALVHLHCACSTVQLLWHSRLPFSRTVPTSPTALSWTHWLQDLGSYTAAWLWVVSQKDWRNWGVTGWIALIQHLSEKMQFSCFPILPGTAEAQVIWGHSKASFDCVLYCNISAKKYQNTFTCVKVITNQRWDKKRPTFGLL